MLKELGCSFAIIGHSERRHVFGESNELVAKRAVGALSQDFKVIFCVGETLSQREASQTSKVLKEQLDAFFALANSLPANYQLNLVVAYEPVWAIGTGKVASLAEIEQAHHSIQESLSKEWRGRLSYSLRRQRYSRKFRRNRRKSARFGWISWRREFGCQ
jgi:triosephosphate isomerase